MKKEHDCGRQAARDISGQATNLAAELDYFATQYGSAMLKGEVLPTPAATDLASIIANARSLQAMSSAFVVELSRHP